MPSVVGVHCQPLIVVEFHRQYALTGPCTTCPVTEPVLLLCYTHTHSHADKSTVQELRSLRVSVEDFVSRGVVGRGHFGEVRVVSERCSGRVLAMKVMKKEDILKQADVRRESACDVGKAVCCVGTLMCWLFSGS